MKTIMLAAMTAVVAASAAGAEPRSDAHQAGHWEWKTPPSYGPRAPLPVSHRVWVPDQRDQAARDCTTTHKAGETCTPAKRSKAG